MFDTGSGEQTTTRRRTLAGVGTAAVALAAGCTGGSDGTDGGSGGTPATPYPELPAPVAGDASAEVTLAVFEDYACPHCADYNAEAFPVLEEAYVGPGEIRYEHRDLPIPVADPGSWQAANAARAVQRRHGDEAFWSYSAALFDRSGDIPTAAPDLFATLAEEQGHDGDTVREAAVGRVHERTIQRDRERATAVGVEATPGFVVNGEVVASGFGSGTVETVSTAIDAALSETA
jgi:protein-disulfide isomerase